MGTVRVPFLYMGATCFACVHSQRELIDQFCSEPPVTLPDGRRIRTAKELQEELLRLCPDENVPSAASLSKHKRYHLYQDNVKYLVRADGVIETTTGKMVPKASVMTLLDTIITLAQQNILEHPEKVSASQGLDAAKLKKDIQGGLRDEQETKKAWLELLARRKQDKKKQPVIIEGEFEGIGGEG